MEDSKNNLASLEDPIQRIEVRISGGFDPVQPDPEFVRHLRYRLANPPEVYLENRPKFVRIYLILGGISVAMIILWLINRMRRMIFS